MQRRSVLKTLDLDDVNGRIVIFTGSISGTHIIQFPTKEGAWWMVRNFTTGSGQLSLRGTNVEVGVSILLASKGQAIVYCANATLYPALNSSGVPFSLSGRASVAMPGSGSLDLTMDEMVNHIIEVTGSRSDATPVAVKFLVRDGWSWMVKNSNTGTASIAVKTATGSNEIRIAAGSRALVYCDASELRVLYAEPPVHVQNLSSDVTLSAIEASAKIIQVTNAPASPTKAMTLPKWAGTQWAIHNLSSNAMNVLVAGGSTLSLPANTGGIFYYELLVKYGAADQRTQCQQKNTYVEVAKGYFTIFEVRHAMLVHGGVAGVGHTSCWVARVGEAVARGCFE